MTGVKLPTTEPALFTALFCSSWSSCRREREGGRAANQRMRRQQAGGTLQSGVAPPKSGALAPASGGGRLARAGLREGDSCCTPAAVLAPPGCWLSTCAGVCGTHVDLQVLHGLGQAQGVKAAVAREAAVQPRGAGGVGQPQRIACGAGGRGGGASGPARLAGPAQLSRARNRLLTAP